MRISWSAVSNAAERSSRLRSVTSPRLAANRTSDITFSTAVSVEWCFLYQTAGSVEDHAAPNMQQVDDRPTSLSTTFDIKVWFEIGL